MKTVSDIVQAFGGPVAFAAFFEMPLPTVHTCRRRNYLPPHRDVDVVTEAMRRKLSLSYEDLAQMRRGSAPP